MNKNTSLLVITSCFTLLLAGILFADVLTIPTKPANHNAYLSTLVLGNSGDTQTIALEATGQDSYNNVNPSGFSNENMIEYQRKKNPDGMKLL